MSSLSLPRVSHRKNRTRNDELRPAFLARLHSDCLPAAHCLFVAAGSLPLLRDDRKRKRPRPSCGNGARDARVVLHDTQSAAQETCCAPDVVLGLTQPAHLSLRGSDRGSGRGSGRGSVVIGAGRDRTGESLLLFCLFLLFSFSSSSCSE